MRGQLVFKVREDQAVDGLYFLPPETSFSGTNMGEGIQLFDLLDFCGRDKYPFAINVRVHIVVDPLDLRGATVIVAARTTGHIGAHDGAAVLAGLIPLMVVGMATTEIANLARLNRCFLRLFPVEILR